MLLFKEKSECEPVWDEIMCWPKTSKNTTVQMACPLYINKFNTKSNTTF